jgi:hypothetical protein
VVEIFPSLKTVPPDLSPAAFYAHLWCSAVDAAMALPLERLLLIDYDELVSNSTGVIRRLTRHLGLSESPEMIARMSGALRVYAKDAGGEQSFDAARAHARPPLLADQRLEVAGVVEDRYARLEALRWAQA